MTVLGNLAAGRCRSNSVDMHSEEGKADPGLDGLWTLDSGQPAGARESLKEMQGRERKCKGKKGNAGKRARRRMAVQKE